MGKLKRRSFLKLVGISIVCPTQLLGKDDILCKITSREDAVRVAEENLLFNRRIIKASDICNKTLSHYGCSLYSDCNYCSQNCQEKNKLTRIIGEKERKRNGDIVRVEKEKDGIEGQDG